MTNYKTIFEAIETTLYEQANDPRAMRAELERFKYSKKRVSDEEFYEISQIVVFASGFRASTMLDYHPGLRKHLPDIATAVALTPDQLSNILKSGDIIAKRKKLEGCVKNALEVQKIVEQYGSIQNYIESFEPYESTKHLMKLREDLIKRFSYIGDVTSYHLMTDLGLPVLKPDRVIMRILYRLGMVYDLAQYFKAVEIGQEFAKATGHPIRYIDIVLVSYGQVETFGKNIGTCLEINPKCGVCKAYDFCEYEFKNRN